MSVTAPLTYLLTESELLKSFVDIQGGGGGVRELVDKCKKLHCLHRILRPEVMKELISDPIV